MPPCCNNGTAPRRYITSSRSFGAGPSLEDGWQGLGKALVDAHCPDDAVAAFTEAARRSPAPARAPYHRGRAHLLAGRFPEGWADYEHRLDVPDLHPRLLPEFAPLLQMPPIPLNELAAIARIIASLDSVVPVDTAVTCLAGALGRRTFRLLDHAAECRWLLNRTDSPWYPSLHRVQQPEPGNWHEAVAQVVSGLHVSRPGPSVRLSSYGSGSDGR